MKQTRVFLAITLGLGAALLAIVPLHALAPGKATRRPSHQPLTPELAAACASCHSDRRPADALHAAAGAECSPCHGTKGWKPTVLDHRKAFRFDRNHPAICSNCHLPGKALKEYTCTGCHTHSPVKMERIHREEGITNIEKCRRCHPYGNTRGTIGGEAD